eukprot:GEMP01028998.1.p1 GENE.GEMP01028998.1~~GEMP01028998.1.p1  ORF type:complete len:523 (+),score=158.39 GEMP01028998.1:41-1570(+)
MNTGTRASRGSAQANAKLPNKTIIAAPATRKASSVLNKTVKALPAAKGPLKKFPHASQAKPVSAPIRKRVVANAPARSAGNAEASEAAPSDAPCWYVRVRGLPFTATPEDVRDVFQNFNVPLRNIYMGVCNSGNLRGRPDGQAYVKMTKAGQAEQCAEQLEGATVGTRYLEFFHTDQADFQQTVNDKRLVMPGGGQKGGYSQQTTQVVIAAPRVSGATGGKRYSPYGAKGGIVAAPVVSAKGIVSAPRVGAASRIVAAPRAGTGVRVATGPRIGAGGIVSAPMVGSRGKPALSAASFPAPSEEDGVVRVRGVPFTATALEVATLFKQYGVTVSDIFMGLQLTGPRAGTPDGQAFVSFRNAKTAESAMKKSQGTTLGSRYVELFKSSELELQQKLDAGAAQEFDEEEYGEDDSGAGYVRLRGLPFCATAADIVEFFGPQFDLTEEEVIMKYNADQRPSGECFVQLPTEETAITAKESLDRKHIGGRYIEVIMSSYSDAARNVRVMWTPIH